MTAETEPAPPQSGQPHQDMSCHDKGMHYRDEWAKAQASAFAKLGLFLSHNPWPVVVVVLAVLFGLGFGVFDAYLETDVTKLWVQTGTRLEDEQDHHDSLYGGLPRTIGVQLTDVAGKSVLTTQHLKEAYDLDASYLDMRIHYNNHPANPCYQMELLAASRNQSLELLCNRMAAVCKFVDNKCMTHDTVGVLPTIMQKDPLVFYWEHNGTKLPFGMRETCLEVPFPEWDPDLCKANDPQETNPTVCRLAKMRAPCSKYFTPMDCFTEPPHSYHHKVVEGWSDTHNISYEDEVGRQQALAEPCVMWQGSYNAKGYTIGGAEYSEDKKRIVAVESWKFVYPLLSPEGFQEKYKYIRTHPTSKSFMDAMNYPMSITRDEALDILEGYEETFHDFMHETRSKYNASHITWLNNWNIDNIVKDASNKNQIFVIIGLVLLLVVVWASLFRLDAVANRLALGLGGVVCIAISVFGTLGFSALCNVQFNGLSLQVLPYVCMGLGIDDMFVLLHYFEENVEKPVGERMQMAYAHGGPSITATSLVNIVVFFLGVTVPVKAVNDFAIQTGIAVVFNYLVVLLAFGAIMAIDAHRIYARRMDVVCLKREKPAPMPSESCARLLVDKALGPFVTHWVGQMIGIAMTLALLGISIWGCHHIELGLKLKAFTEEGTQEYDYLNVRHRLFAAEGNYVIGKEMDWHTEENQIKLNRLVTTDLTHPDSYWAEQMRLFGLGQGKMLHVSKTYLLATTAWSSVFRRIALTIPASWPARGNSLACTELGGRGYLAHESCIVNPDNYYDLLGYLLGVRGACPAVDTNYHSGRDFWLRLATNLPVTTIPTCSEVAGFLAKHGVDDAADTACQAYTDPLTCMNAGCLFDNSIRRCLNSCAEVGKEANSTLKAQACLGAGCLFHTLTNCTNSLRGGLAPYRDDVFVDVENGTVKRIRAHRLTVINEPAEQSDIANTLDMMEEMRDLLDNYGLDMYAYGQSFLYGEQYRFTRENLRNVLAITLACSLVLMSILMSSIVIGIIQTVVITMSMVAILATLPLLDLGLNGVSLLSAVFGVGINVELAVHISRAFLTAQSSADTAFGQRKDRVTIALREMSQPVFSGALTTFVGVLILVASDVQFFREYFFGLYSMMILISLFHAFVPLPILLCFFGPQSLPDHDEEIIRKEPKAEEPFADGMHIEMEDGDRKKEDVEL